MFTEITFFRVRGMQQFFYFFIFIFIFYPSEGFGIKLIKVIELEMQEIEEKNFLRRVKYEKLCSGVVCE